LGQIIIDTVAAYTYNVGMADILGGFEQAVLLAVAKLGSDAYGRAILKEVAIRLDRKVSAGAVYATLDRLEAKGLLSSRLAPGTPSRGGRSRRYYRLKAAGVNALNETRATLENLWQGAIWPIGGHT
jgi:DNA-binding PadR family transcriptional regulator